jgi:hypothetical protein
MVSDGRVVNGAREAISVAIDKRRGRIYYTGESGRLGRTNLDGSGAKQLPGAGTLIGIMVVDLPERAER